MRGNQSSSVMTTQLHDLAYPSLKTAIEKILSLGIEGAPEEVCGLLIEEAPGVFRVIQMINRADDPTAGYRIDGETVQQLSIDSKHWSHVSIWHTHPGGLVGPSAGDLKHKQPNVKYLVVTVPTGEVVWF